MAVVERRGKLVLVRVGNAKAVGVLRPQGGKVYLSRLNSKGFNC